MNRPWIFMLLAFALVIYFWVPMLRMVLEVKHEPEPDLLNTRTKPAVTRRPPDENTIVAERNLLGALQEKGSTSSEEIELMLLKGIRVADKDLGLTLVGTVLADDPKMNIAFIDNRSTRQQEPYHEGDRIGEILVKRIFRNNVIIETERGEEVLVMLFEGTAGRSSSGSVGLPNSSSPSSENRGSAPSESEGGESSLTDLEPTVSSGPLYGSSSSVGDATTDGGGSSLSSSSSSRDASSSSSENNESESSLTDLEPTVSSGPLW